MPSSRLIGFMWGVLLTRRSTRPAGRTVSDRVSTRHAVHRLAEPANPLAGYDNVAGAHRFAAVTRCRARQSAARASARHTSGVVPVQRWNARNSEFGSANPRRKPISVALSSVDWK